MKTIHQLKDREHVQRRVSGMCSQPFNPRRFRPSHFWYTTFLAKSFWPRHFRWEPLYLAVSGFRKKNFKSDIHGNCNWETNNFLCVEGPLWDLLNGENFIWEKTWGLNWRWFKHVEFVSVETRRRHGTRPYLNLVTLEFVQPYSETCRNIKRYPFPLPNVSPRLCSTWQYKIIHYLEITNFKVMKEPTYQTMILGIEYTE